MTDYGYARVSTKKAKGRKEQHVDTRSSAGSGGNRPAGGSSRMTACRAAKASRPEWDKLLGVLRRGDTLTVTSMTRIGRSLRQPWTS